jgi:hypothetical protein
LEEQPVIEGIIASLVATAIAAVLTVLYNGGYLHFLIENVLFHIAASGLREHRLLPRETTDLQANLVRRLLHDQSRFGHYKGQFGKSCDVVNSAKRQPRGSKENLNFKPRIYLTYWPVVILHAHGLAPRSVRLAISGVAGLFSEDRIPVHTSAPSLSPTGRDREWSHRHSMAGAHLLAVEDPNNDVTRSVIDQMLDQRNGWQDGNGGWWQTSERIQQPDLWASVYAVKLLDFVCSKRIDAFKDKTDFIRASIARTFAYLETEWIGNRWSYPGKLLLEENLAAMFIHLAPLFPRYSPRLAGECLATMTEWLSPTGDLSRSYLATLETQSSPLHVEQAYVRMAYAFHSAQGHSVEWRPWFEKVARSSLDRLFASELAFLLDLSFAYDGH